MAKHIIQTLLSICLIANVLFGYCQAPSDSPAVKLYPKDLKYPGKVLLVKVRDVEAYKIKQYRKLFTKSYSGAFEIVPFNVSIDLAYPDTSTYKYVYVIAGGLHAEDFNGISNTTHFFDKTGSSFLHIGSSVYLFDRSSDQPIYDFQALNVMNGISYIKNGRHYHTNNDNSNIVNIRKVKAYLKLLN